MQNLYYFFLSPALYNDALDNQVELLVNIIDRAIYMSIPK